MPRTTKINPAHTHTDQAEDVDSRFGSTDLLLLLMTLIRGSNFTAIKLSMGDNLLPLSFNGLRFLLASALMSIVAFGSGHGMKKD